jgi:hypothetical protein
MRRGDEYTQNSDPTNATISSLVYAIWIIRFEMQGYVPQERTHDPFKETDHVVSVTMRPQGH